MPSSAAWNEKNVKGAKEHSIIKFYPQARVTEYDEKAFDSVELVTGTQPGGDGEPEAKTEVIEGRIVRYVYEHKPGTSAFEILRQYEAALGKAGFVKLLAGRVDKLPAHGKIGGEVFGAFRLDRDGKPAVYTNLSASDQGDWIESTLTIAEPDQMEQKLDADADGFYKALKDKGRVAVYGINFDTGKATIRPDSEAVLSEIRKLLADHPDLRLKVEGHTDNVGAPAANQKLSEARAAAVVAWLGRQGIKPDRLTPARFGDTKPIVDNTTEEGRTKNRRVELAR
ncbi:OmpA family protein [Bradyrhizobium sp. NAS80.1]|uniref:OmpA family protein n=1 Tax=Bradyrhizobium sp. NAS80.1 TaxID=1680159 RepID=UPI00143D9EEB|nr:OmpA family protein [Bradyrhizobium sp. NAS80.1]